MPNEMPNEIIDIMASLTSLMEEESGQLARYARVPEHEHIAQAKLRLVGRLESEVTRLSRETPGWLEALDPEPREALASTTKALLDASAVNARAIERQIEVSTDMMNAIVDEAKRLNGTRNTIYGATGGLTGRDESAPISINTRL